MAGFVVTGMTQEMYDEQIRNKAIDDFAEKMKREGIDQGFHCDDTSCELCDFNCDKCEGRFRNAVDEIAEQLKEGRVNEIIAEEHNNGWIPVSERLPNVEECLQNRAEFWITDKEGNTYQATFSRRKADWFDSHDGTILDVIAWQPLPQAYKGEV